MPDPQIKLVSDTTSQNRKVATYPGTFSPIGIFDNQGRPYYRSESTAGGGSSGGQTPPPVGGGDEMKTPFEKLKQNVKWLNAILGAAVVTSLGGFAGLFFALDDRINDRFDRADEKIVVMVEKVSDIRVNTAKQDAKLDRILEKVSDVDAKTGD